MDEFQTRQFWKMKPQDIKPITYRHLKELLNSLDESHLDHPVRWGGDNTSGLITGTWLVEEDQINPSGDGWEPKSAYKDDPDFDVTDEPVVCPSGSLILLCE